MTSPKDDTEYLPGRYWEKYNKKRKHCETVQNVLFNIASQWLSLIQNGELSELFTIANVQTRLKDYARRRINEVATAWKLCGLLIKEHKHSTLYRWNPYLNPAYTHGDVFPTTLVVLDIMRSNKDKWYGPYCVGVEGDRAVRDAGNTMNILWGTGFLERHKKKYKWIL